MADNQLPLTRARLANSLIIKVYALTGFDPISALFQAPLTPGKILTVVRKFARKQDREIYRRYDLDHQFEPRDLIPLKVKTDLTLERVVLYKEDCLQGFGLTFSGSLVEQQLPFIIQEIRTAPLGQDGKSYAGTYIVEYLDCWFTSNPIAYDAMSPDQLVIQEVGISCGAVRSIPADSLGQAALFAQSSGGLSIGAPYVNNVINALATGKVDIITKAITLR